MPGERVETISRDIEKAILVGEYQNGMRLDEACLAEKYAVSRTPVREALRILSTTGLVQLVPNKGAFVHFPDIAELIEMFEVMGELEALAGRLAARRISDEQLKALEAACEQCNLAIDGPDPDGYFVENQRFHHLIYEASGNAFLAGEASNLFRRLEPIRRSQLKARGRTSQSMREHQGILEAIRDGDGEAAAQRLRAHIVIQGEKFTDLISEFRNRGLQQAS